jgi:hypothetical protein
LWATKTSWKGVFSYSPLFGLHSTTVTKFDGGD